MFFVQAEDDSVFGAFISELKEMTSFTPDMFHTFTDSDSFLYYFKSKQNKYMTHKALKFAKNNIGYELKDHYWKICFGSIYGDEGLSFAFQKSINKNSDARFHSKISKHECGTPSPGRSNHENWGCCKISQSATNRDIDEQHSKCSK